MSKKVIVIAPHPDDEILGCGGSLLRYIEEGYQVAWLICTEPPKDMHWSDDFFEQRQKDIEHAYVFKKVHQIHTFDYPPYTYFELYIMPLID